MRPLTPSDPVRIGRYDLEGRLGAGGMGTVYLGHSPGGRPAAIKVINVGLESDPEALLRFQREAEVLRTVRNAYTAGLIDCELTTPPYWMATEYIPGPTLAAALADWGPMPVDQCFRLAAALAEGLADIHAHGICHRDLKPANIIMSPIGPRLIDFGLARGLAEFGLTQSGMAVGTAGFAAPESMEGEELTPAADVFALGATVAHAATGRRPYGNGSMDSIYLRCSRGDIDVAGADPELAALVRACVARDPGRRPSLDQIIEYCRDRRLAGLHDPTGVRGAVAPVRVVVAGTGLAALPAPEPVGVGDRSAPHGVRTPPSRPSAQALPSRPGAGVPALAPGGDRLAEPPARRRHVLVVAGSAVAALVLIVGGAAVALRMFGAGRGDAAAAGPGVSPAAGAACPGSSSGATGNGTRPRIWACDGSPVRRPSGTSPARTPSGSSPARTPADGRPSKKSSGTRPAAKPSQTSPAARPTADGGRTIIGPGGACLDVNGDDIGNNGAYVQLWACQSYAVDQRWTHNADDSLETMGRCLDIDGNGTANGAKLELWTCNGVGGQKWEFQPDGSLFNPQSGRCLDAPDDATANGTRLQIWDCNGSPAQRFSFG